MFRFSPLKTVYKTFIFSFLYSCRQLYALPATYEKFLSASAKNWSVTFPRFQGWTDITSGTKAQTYDANNTVSVSITDCGTYAKEGEFFIRAYYGGSWHDVSESSSIYSYQGTQDINLNDPSATKGVKLMLRGKNGNYSIYHVSAKGTVDFH